MKNEVRHLSIIDTLITDRTQADVDRVLTLSAKGWAAMTAAEREEFEAGMKGAYNATDLNRVNAAMEYLESRLVAMGYTGGYYQRVKVPHKQSGGGSVLPEGYTQVAYIQSGGTQYVDTGFKPNQDTRVVMDFELLSVTGQYADPIFGVRTSASAAGYYFWASGTAVATEQYQSGYNNSSTYPAVTRVGRHTVDKNKNVTTVDGVTTEAAYAAFTTAWNMLLFQSYNNGNLYSQTTKMRLYSCQIYDNGQLIRDYIPCIDPSGEVGLYDTVDGLFYGNEGTGAFVAGPDVNPEPIGGNDEHTLLLLHGDSLEDSSQNQVPISNSGVVVSAAQSKFGGSSLYFNGSSAYLTASSNGFNFGEGNFTFDWWEYCTGNSATRFALSISGGCGGICAGGSLDTNRLYLSSSGTTWDLINGQAALSKTANTWVHWAVVRDGGSLKTYRNGTLFWSGTISGSIYWNGTGLVVGSFLYDASHYFGGYFDEFRVSDIARWTEDFTPPSSPYTEPVEPEPELDPYTWYVSDIPTPEALEAYLDNVRRFRSAKPLFATTPQVPDDMELATIDEWNDIEQILVDIEISLISIAKAAIYAGTPYIFAGGPMIYATGG